MVADYAACRWCCKRRFAIVWRLILSRSRRPASRGGLVHHSDRGAQYVSIKYTERLAEAGIEPSVGSVGDSYDNALAETINGLYKAEVIHRRGPWRSFEAIEFQPSRGWTGSTIAGCWSPSASSRRPKPRNATSPCSNDKPMAA